MSDICVSLYDKTGAMMHPWLEAGRLALLVDIQHPPGLSTDDGRLWRLGCDLRAGFTMPAGLPKHGDVEFAAAFPPCDHLAVSGARWFRGKGLRKLAFSVDLFATAAEACEATGAPYQIENPVSTISTYWRAPDFTFNPWYFTGYEPADNYTKKTCLWTGGGFVMPERFEDLFAGAPDNRIHTMPPGPERANKLSATPLGYARAVFRANCHEARLGLLEST
jgi:hypothetical protein